MSRIQDILNKAERDGGVRRTRGLGVDAPGVAPAPPLTGASAAAAPRPVAEPTPIAERREARARHLEPSLAPPVPPITPVAPAAPHRDHRFDHRLVAALAPQSLAAEQYRSLRARISRAENGRAVRTIIVTSPSKGDGKSLTAANLSLTMAQEFSQRVLLIDADLRRPSIHHLFDVPEAPGLTDILVGAATLDDALVTLPDQHLTILPSGVPPSHPAELLGSAAMRRTLDMLRTRFDRIVLDMPPVSPLADVQIASAVADGIVLIVRAGITPKPAIERALAGLDPAKVLGLVLNETGPESGADTYYNGYGYIAG
jgi:capsular exopolysaccharide synthesis family protein